MYTAQNVNRIYVGIAEQNVQDEVTCITPALLHLIPCCTPYQRKTDELDNDNVNNNSWNETLADNVDHNKSVNGLTRNHYRNSYNISEDVYHNVVITNDDDKKFDQFASSMCYFYDNLRIRRTSAVNALGPIMGRYLAMLLYRGEDMAIVLDSHNRFIPFWDVQVMNLYHKYDDDNALLSHYPEGWTDTDNFAFIRSSTVYLCKSEFIANLEFVKLNGIIIYNTAPYWKNNKFNDPFVTLQSSAINPNTNFRLPQPWVAGGFLFGNASFIRNVPFDPHLPYIFQGEEVLYSTRLWTHGYNIYSPEQNICYHMYGRTNAPKIWHAAASWSTIERLSQRRLYFYLQTHDKNVSTPKISVDTTDEVVVIDVHRYGMGKERTLTQWYNYAGVDAVQHKVDGRWCN